MSVTFVNIEQQKSIRENILDIISNISPKERPVLAKLGRQNVTNTTVITTTEELASPSASNQNAHGATITFAAADWKVRGQETNYTQLLIKKVSVDKTMQAVVVAGAPEGEWERQKKLKLDELLNDVEATLVSANVATAPLPNTGTAGIAAGIQTFIPGANTVDASGAPYNGLLTKPAYNALAQNVYKSGGKADAAFMGAQAKDAVAGWVQQVNRPVSDDGKKLTDVVNQVETTVGFQDLILERNLASVVLMVETKYWKTGWLRSPEFMKTGITGDFDGGYYACEMTLCPLAPSSSGKITGLGYTI